MVTSKVRWCVYNEEQGGSARANKYPASMIALADQIGKLSEVLVVVGRCRTLSSNAGCRVPTQAAFA